MHSTSVPPWHTCYYPFPKHLFPQHQNFNLAINKSLKHSIFSTPRNSLFPHYYYYHAPYSTANNCIEEQHRQPNPLRQNQPSPNILNDWNSSGEPPDTHSTDDKDDKDSQIVGSLGIFSNVWWAELRAALGQRINVEGLVSSVGILAKDNHLVIPHVRVPDISLSLYEPLGSSLEECKSLFGNNVAVFSNSAGLYEYDPDCKEAKALERAIGMKVIRHRMKKPAGTAEEIERHFGCEATRVIMVGDRPFTDIVFGNRNDFLTILTDPLSVAEEPFIVKQVRKLEVALVNWWSQKGFKTTRHRLFLQPQRCVKDQPL